MTPQNQPTPNDRQERLRDSTSAVKDWTTCQPDCYDGFVSRKTVGIFLGLEAGGFQIVENAWSQYLTAAAGNGGHQAHGRLRSRGSRRRAD